MQTCVVSVTLDEAGDGKPKIAGVTQMSMPQGTERERWRRQELDTRDIISKESELHNQGWRQL